MTWQLLTAEDTSSCLYICIASDIQIYISNIYIPTYLSKASTRIQNYLLLT